MFFPSVTEEQVKAVRRLTYQQRADLIAEINNVEPTRLFEHVDGGKDDEIICPICGNGTGENHSGVVPTLTANGWLYGCRRPAAGGQCNFNGLLTGVIAKETGLNQKDFNGLCEILAIGAEFCGITVSPSGIEEAHRRRPQQRPVTGKKERKDYSQWLSFARQNLPAFIKECGGSWRGFTLQELQAAGAGFSDNDTGRRVLIPYNNFHVLGRAVDKDTPNPKMHFGSKKIDVYNFDAVDTNHIIFVVEGEIDCLSIKTASGGKIHVVALGGAGEYGKLIHLLNEKFASVEIKPRFVIIFDNDVKDGVDNTGQTSAPEAVATLMDNGYPAASYILSETPNFDANDWFVKDRAGLLERMKDLEKEAETELAAAALEIQNRVTDAMQELQAQNAAAVSKFESSAKIAMQEISDAAAVQKLKEHVRTTIQELQTYAEPTAPKTPARLKAAASKLQSHAEAAMAELKFRIDAVVKVVEGEIAFIKTNQRDDFKKLRSQPDSPARTAAMREIILKNLDWCYNDKGKPTKVKACAKNYRAVFDNDAELCKLFGYDEFYGRTVFLRQAPWRKEKCIGTLWTDDDSAALRIFLRENYAELSHREMTPDYFRLYSQINRFNVVQDWLNNLPAWDGKPRAETIFIDFLKVADDKDGYARECTMNFLFGALARIFYPGCKINYTPVLQGRQGCGKSYVLEKLGGDWHANLEDKIGSEKAIDALQNLWIVELGEMSATRKAELNELKNFLTETHDNHRFAYDKFASRRPRHSVFAGTCNDEEPLLDRTGNRRFLILKCGNKRGEFVEGFTKEYVQQVWAEALAKFRQMFPTDEDFDANKLLLSEKSRAIADRLAEGATADDGLEAEISAFLNKPVLAAPIWRLLTKNERCKFIAEGKIVIAVDEFKNRQATRRRRKETAELTALLETMTPEEIRGKNGELVDMAYKLYGSAYREHICAAEILAEMTNRPDRRLNMRRINEVLSMLDGWQKGERLQNVDAEYGDQKNPFYRITPLDFEEEETEPPPDGNDDNGGDTSGSNDFKDGAEEDFDTGGNKSDGEFNDTGGESSSNTGGGNDSESSNGNNSESSSNNDRTGLEDIEEEFLGYQSDEKTSADENSAEYALFQARYMVWYLERETNAESIKKFRSHFNYWRREYEKRKAVAG